MNFKKTGSVLATAIIAGIGLTACMDDAAIANSNIKKAADNFEVNRRIVFYNGITDTYLLSIEGKCSIDLNQAGTAFNVICKTGPNEFKRHTLVLSDNVTAFAEQIDSNTASTDRYRVTFKPSSLIRDVDLR